MSEKEDILFELNVEESGKPVEVNKILVLINRFNHSFVVDVQGTGVEEEYSDVGCHFANEWFIDNFPEIKEPGLYSIVVNWRTHRDWETGIIDDTEMYYISHEKIAECYRFPEEK